LQHSRHDFQQQTFIAFMAWQCFLEYYVIISISSWKTR
jgi:hypothetical protein